LPAEVRAPYETLAHDMEAVAVNLGWQWSRADVFFGVSFPVPSPDYLAGRFLNPATTTVAGYQPRDTLLNWTYATDFGHVLVQVQPEVPHSGAIAAVFLTLSLQRAFEPPGIDEVRETLASVEDHWRRLVEIGVELVPVASQQGVTP
jgi:hypothetical protein